mmetsp:Transcript_52988/g.103654  ORF Transcript_52988/g.103654 Transcript_52988/m.103654 type:complete len:100 (-) Transcript_52988:1343-1642(-)
MHCLFSLWFLFFSYSATFLSLFEPTDRESHHRQARVVAEKRRKEDRELAAVRQRSLFSLSIERGLEDGSMGVLSRRPHLIKTERGNRGRDGKGRAQRGG